MRIRFYGADVIGVAALSCPFQMVVTRKYTSQILGVCYSAAGVISFFVALAVWMGLAYESALPNSCENYVVSEVISPNKKLKTVIFERGCGATTNQVQHISLLKAKEKLPDEVGNLLNGDEISAESITAKWRNNTSLEISGAYWKKDSPPKTTLNGVQIYYK